MSSWEREEVPLGGAEAWVGGKARGREREGGEHVSPRQCVTLRRMECNDVRLLRYFFVACALRLEQGDGEWMDTSKSRLQVTAQGIPVVRKPCVVFRMQNGPKRPPPANYDQSCLSNSSK